MDASTGLLFLITFAALGIVGTLGILRKQRLTTDTGQHPVESQFAVSTEGMVRCPNCGMGNLVGDTTCSGCGRGLPQQASLPGFGSR